MRISPSLELPGTDRSLVMSALHSFSLKSRLQTRGRKKVWPNVQETSHSLVKADIQPQWLQHGERWGNHTGVVSTTSFPYLHHQTHDIIRWEQSYLLSQMFQEAPWAHFSSVKNHIVDRAFSPVTWADYRLICKYPEGNPCLISHPLHLLKCMVLHKY